MRFRTRSVAALSLLMLAALSACGDEAESAAPRPAPALEPTGPLDSIPRDSLYGATAAENIRVVPVEITARDLPAGWNGLRVAAVSDFQLGLWPDNEQVARAAVQRAVETGAEVIALLGGYVESAADTTALARVLEPLRGRTSVAVLGEEDVVSDSLEEAVVRTLSRAGVQVLRNSAVPLVFGGDSAAIGGVDPELVGDPVADQEWILATLGGGARLPLLLTHIPGVAVRAPERRYAAILAGNTFCGSVEIPGAARLSWLNETVLPGARIPEEQRLYVVEGNPMFVTCGVGYSFLPVRLGAPPEVALITLTGIEAAPPAEAEADTLDADSLLRQLQGTDTTAAANPG